MVFSYHADKFKERSWELEGMLQKLRSQLSNSQFESEVQHKTTRGLHNHLQKTGLTGIEDEDNVPRVLSQKVRKAEHQQFSTSLGKQAEDQVGQGKLHLDSHPKLYRVGLTPYELPTSNLVPASESLVTAL
jgi:hypothetical protein